MMIFMLHKQHHFSKILVLKKIIKYDININYKFSFLRARN